MTGIALIVIGSLCFAAYRDFVARQIPDWVSVLCTVAFVVAALVFLESGTFLDGVKLAAPVFIGTFILFAIGQLGGGDVKLLTATALWAGASYALDFLVITAFAGGILASGYLVNRKIGHLLKGNVADADLESTGDVVIEPLAVPYGIAIAIGTTVIMVDRFLI